MHPSLSLMGTNLYDKRAFQASGANATLSLLHRGSSDSRRSSLSSANLKGMNRAGKGGSRISSAGTSGHQGQQQQMR